MNQLSLTLTLCTLLISGYTLLSLSSLRNFFTKHARILYYLTLLVLSVFLFWRLHVNFSGLVNAPLPTRYYAPPYTPISFFIYSAWLRILGPVIFSIAVSLLSYLTLSHLKTYQERLDPDEPTKIALCLLLLPHPIWLIFTIISALSYALIAAVNSARGGAHTRTSLSSIWFSLALLSSAVAPLLTKIPIYKVISFTSSG